MGLKETSNTLCKLLEECCKNLQKSANGNKAAAQRVRTGTIKLEKIAKLYRKESVAADKKGGAKRATAKAKAPVKKAAKKAVKKVKKK
jgi:DNA-binding protein H-NS